MNILFVNYGDFTTNSLNHIGAFANRLTALGHGCVVAVPEKPETLACVPSPAFVPALYRQLLAGPPPFPDGRPADLIHAWTPRENVRRFVLAYQPRACARLIIHLEDNEEFLLAAWIHESIAGMHRLTEDELTARGSPQLSHPRRYRHLLRVADGVTCIIASLAEFVPAGVPLAILPPGIDFTGHPPLAPDPELRRELGLQDGEKVIVFTGSNTFANEPEMRDLYLAVAQLNAGGARVRLVRTGLDSPAFQSSLPEDVKARVLNLGFVEKARLPKLLALADVLVQPGRPGPFNAYRLPSKLPEFLSAGKPVVLPATNIGLELRDGVDALLLSTGAPEEIAGACARIFGDPQLARTLGGNALAFARRHFDLNANTEYLAGFYATVRAQTPRPGSTSAMADGQAETSLSLRALAGQARDAESAELAATLAPLVEQLERNDPGRAERERFERERIHWRHEHELIKQHAANVGEKLAATEKHLGNLTGKLASTEKHLGNLTGKLASTEKHLGNLTGELAAARQHSVNLGQLRDALQRHVGALNEELARLTRSHAQVLRQRDTKIRAMQASFSWHITAPLRFLRRQLIDPWQRRPAPPAVPTQAEAVAPPAPTPAAAPTGAALTIAPTGLPIWLSVDHPNNWSLPPRPTLLRGWCFADDGRKLTAVRAVLPDRTIAGKYGFKRLDVLASVRGKPQAEYSGWKIEIEFTPADTRLELEAADESGTWHRFFHTPLRVGDGLAPPDLTTYEKWTEAYDSPTPESLRAQAAQAATLAHRPLLSVLMPVYNTPERWLRRAVESVLAQSYPHWELCIADDASPEPQVRCVLEEFRGRDHRIKVVFRETNGHISAASNSALDLATGDYTALLDHDDELAPNALLEVAAAINVRPDADYLYSDEDKIDEEGRRFEPYFKPDFLPDLFLSQNYTSHLSVYRTALLRQAGGFREGYEGSQDWDLALRVFERSAPARIVHLPRILYHWRAIPGSTALLLSEKNYPVEAARRALAGHFARLGQPVELLPVPGDHWRVKYPLPSPTPLVSLIIPTRNSLPFVRRCVGSILAKTSYPNFEVLIVDNHSDDPATLAWFREVASDGVRILPYPQAFNYSAINNFAVRHARGEIIGLLNNDLEVINDDWLDEMVSHAVRPGIGCVGAMLYYPNEAIQHAGVIIGLGGVAGHAFRDFPRGTEGKFNRARLVQNYSAVTAACLVIRKRIYEEVGGLDEQALAVAFNDIDFCLKVRAAGYRNLWTPFAELYHHESATRGTDDTPEKEERFRNEVETMMRRWGPALTRDPAYNPNLTLELNDFSLAAPPRPAFAG